MTPAGNGVGRADREELQRVIALVADWPATMRQVFTLRKVYEQRPAEIARTLGLSDREVEQYLIDAALACARACGRHFAHSATDVSAAARRLYSLRAQPAGGAL